MLSDKLQNALSDHMTQEFHAAYTYLAMAAHFEAEDLPGFAHFFRVQYHEELEHGMKFFDFLAEAGARPDVGAITEPRKDYPSPKAAFDYSLEQEKKVTHRINELMDLSVEEKAHAASVFLQWFVTEQMEEEALFGTYVKRLELIGEDGQGIVALDHQLAGRPAHGSGG